MAERISFDVAYGPGAADWTGHAEWEVISADTQKATVLVKVYTYLINSEDAYTYSRVTAHVAADGNLVVDQSYDGYLDYDAVLVGSGTFEIYFDSSGNASSYVAISLRASGGTFSGARVSGGATITAKAPYGPSEINLNVSEVQMGKKLIIALDRDSANFTHKLTYSFGSREKEAIESDVGASYAWEVPCMAAECNNATEGECTIYCETFNGTTRIGDATSATVKLLVPDPTVPTVPGSTVTLGTRGTVNCPRGDENFSLKLEYEFGSITDELMTGKADSYSWLPAYDIAAAVPNGISAAGKIKCTTYNGTAQVGEVQTVTVMANVPDNDTTKPTINSFELEPISDLEGDLAGLYIRGKTGVQVETEAEGKYGATITAYTVTAGSVKASGNPAVIDQLADTGDVRVTVTVKDSRGYTRTAETTINVLAYRKPRVSPATGQSSVICERAKSNWELASDGTYLAIRAGKSFSSFVFDGTERNSCCLRYRYRPINGSFSNWITLLDYNSLANEVNLLISDVVSDKAQAYVVELNAIDKIGGEAGSGTDSHQIMTEVVSFVLFDGPMGAGFGMYPVEPNTVELSSALTLHVHGKLIVDGDDFTDLGMAPGVDDGVEDYGRYGGVGYAVKEGNHAYVAFCTSFTYTGVPAVMNLNPIPAEYRPRRTVCSLCPADNQQIAMVSVAPDGYIRVDGVIPLSSSARSGAVLWIDGYLDYWT